MMTERSQICLRLNEPGPASSMVDVGIGVGASRHPARARVSQIVAFGVSVHPLLRDQRATLTVISPSFAIEPRMTSPRSTAPTPSGVPVISRSPGSSVS